MQTDSITGRATSRAAPMADQTLSPTRKQGSEKFDDFVEKARKGDLAEKNNRPEQALNTAAEVKSRPDSKDDAEEQGASSRPGEDFPDPMTKKNLSRSEPGQIDNRTGPANSAQKGDAETGKPLVRADLAQIENARTDQKQSEGQGEIDDAVPTEPATGLRNEGPATPGGVTGAQGSDSQRALGAGIAREAARGAEMMFPPAAAQADRQTPEFTGLTPSATAGSSALLSETGALGRQGSGNADTLSRYQQPGVSPPSALPVANSPRTTPDNQAGMNGQPWSAAELAKSEQAAIGRTRAEMLPVPPAFQPQPPAATNAALATIHGMTRAAKGGMANPAGLLATPDPGSVFTDSGVSDRNFAGLVESSLPGGSGRSVEYFTGSPQAARLVAGQLATALITQQGNRVEISLTPAELGRVRMVLSTSEAGVLVSISAERPETLDMMRRHIDQLADEFRKLGYADIGFEFSGGRSDGAFEEDPTVPHPDDETGPDFRRGAPASGPEPTIRAYVSRGLDLRL